MTTVTASPAAATTVTAAQPVPGTTQFNGVACSSATTCVAVGRGGPGEAVVVPVTNGTPSAVQVFPGLPEFVGVACSSATTRLVVGSRSVPNPPRRPGSEGLIVPVTNGVAGTPLGVPTVGRLVDVACPSATVCHALGVVGPPAVTVVVTITDGIAGAVQSLSGPYGLEHLACPTTTTCYAVGESASQGIVVPITNGTPGAVQGVPGSSFLFDVACPSATTCYAVGLAKNYQALLVPITNGTLGAAQRVRSAGLSAIACLSATTCEAVGANDTGGAVVPIVNGIPGDVVAVPGSNAFTRVACASATTCVAAGGGGSFPDYIGVVATITEGPTSAVTLTCSKVAPTTGAGYLKCRATDPDGIQRIRVVDNKTQAVEQSIAFSCGPAKKITTAGFRIPDDGHSHRVVVTDCSPFANHPFIVAQDGTVTPVSGT